MPTKVTLASLTQPIPDEAAYDWLESIHWPDGPVCPHCGTIGHAYHLKPQGEGRKTRTGNISQRKVWKCGACRKQFSVIKGTSMEGSKIPVRKWVLAFRLVSAAKNGMSSHELGRQLDISHESAWFMSHCIRYSFTPSDPQPPLSGIVEAGETYVGGRHHKVPGTTALDWKVPVVTLVERGGEARSVVMPSVTSKNLKAHLTEQIAPDAHLMTDKNQRYNSAGRTFAAHESVDHGDEEWVRGNAHINTAEGFFSQFKRSLDGTHHHVSPKHLHRYAAEFDFRCNTRNGSDGERMTKAVRRSAGKRLRYESVKVRPGSA